MMPQLCGVDLAIQIKESTLFRASNVGCLGRHRRAGKRTFEDKGQKGDMWANQPKSMRMPMPGRRARTVIVEDGGGSSGTRALFPLADLNLAVANGPHTIAS